MTSPSSLLAKRHWLPAMAAVLALLPQVAFSCIISDEHPDCHCLDRCSAVCGHPVAEYFLGNGGVFGNLAMIATGFTGKIIVVCMMIFLSPLLYRGFRRRPVKKGTYAIVLIEIVLISIPLAGFFFHDIIIFCLTR